MYHTLNLLQELTKDSWANPLLFAYRQPKQLLPVCKDAFSDHFPQIKLTAPHEPLVQSLSTSDHQPDGEALEQGSDIELTPRAEHDGITWTLKSPAPLSSYRSFYIQQESGTFIFLFVSFNQI